MMIYIILSLLKQGTYINHQSITTIKTAGRRSYQPVTGNHCAHVEFQTCGFLFTKVHIKLLSILDQFAWVDFQIELPGYIQTILPLDQNPPLVFRSSFLGIFRLIFRGIIRSFCLRSKKHQIIFPQPELNWKRRGVAHLWLGVIFFS